MTTANIRKQIVSSLRDKEAREAFVEAHIESGVSFQILANRLSRGLSQQELGERCGMKQAAISRLEGGRAGLPNLSTLLRLASAFDVAMIVRFVPFSELVDWSVRSSRGRMSVVSFENDANLGRIYPRSTTDNVIPFPGNKDQNLRESNTTWNLDSMNSIVQAVQ